MNTTSLKGTLAIGIIATVLPLHAQIVFDATADFSITNGNPNGVWSYGWMPTDFSTFNLMSIANTEWAGRGSYGWRGETPADGRVWVEMRLHTEDLGTPAGWLALHPGTRDEPSVIRWTSPSSGSVHIVGLFLPGDSGIMQVAVRKGAEVLWQEVDAGQFDLATPIEAAQTIDFAVFGGEWCGTTPLQTTIILDSEPDQPPHIWTQPVGRTTLVEDTVRLNVVATGAWPFTYQWRKEDVILDGKTNATLTLTNVSLPDAGDYTVVVTNAFGSVTSAVARLTVFVRPTQLFVSLDSPNPTPPYTNWAAAAHVIQDAVDAAAVGATILVTNGVYAVGSRDGNRVTITNSIRLESVNGPLATTIDGGGSVRCVHLGDNAVLSGFTLTNGYVFMAPGGGALGGTLYNCTLTENSSFPRGAGGGSSTDSLYSNGGGASGATLYNCTLTGNSAVLGGGASDSTLYNCVLTGNSGGYGGGACYSTLCNCVVADNVAAVERGGGAWGSTLLNCTLTGNSAASGGGASACTLYNSISYYNTGGNYAEGTTLNYCCTTPLPTTGVGNITGPPLFMDMAGGDFRLREESPCIDVGTNLMGFPVAVDEYFTGEPVLVGRITDPTDILGTSRFIDGNGDGTVAWDIGAYEFNPASMQLVDIPDTGLLAVIRAALNKPTGDLTVGDMERLTVLDAGRQARGPEAPLIRSLEGLRAARNLTQLNLSGGAAESPNIAVSDFSPLAGLTNLTTLRLEGNQLTSVNLPAGLRGLRELHLAGNQLTSLALPEGLTGLRYLDVRGNPITYLAVPESMDLSQLVLEGFPLDQVTIVMLRIGPAKVRSDGSIQLPVSGPNGQTVRVQRSTNLVDWVDWQTVTLNGTVKELLDAPAAIPLRFYRVVQAEPNATR